MEKNLGHATAYGYAKSKGYSGTEDEFAELMADYASVGQSAAQSAEQAAASAESASGSAATASQAAQTATSKASEAVTAADTATTKASEANQSASTASAAATSAGTSAQTATTAASTATTKASEASESATTASAAKTDAETARDAAAQSASEAAESARTLTIDDTLTQAGQAADAKVVGDRVGFIQYGDICSIDELRENGFANIVPDFINHSVVAKTGEISSENTKRCTNKELIYIPDGATIETTVTNEIYNPKPYCFDKNMTFIGQSSEQNELLQNTRYVRFLIARKDDGAITPEQAKSYFTLTIRKYDEVAETVAIISENGKNLVYSSEWNEISASISLNDDNVVLTAIESGTYKTAYTLIDVSDSNSITISLMSKTDGDAAGTASVRYGFVIDGTNVWQNYITSFPFTIDVSNYDTITIGLYVAQGSVESGTSVVFNRLQIEKGTSATDFAKYLKTAIDYESRNVNEYVAEYNYNYMFSSKTQWAQLNASVETIGNKIVVKALSSGTYRGVYKDIDVTGLNSITVSWNYKETTSNTNTAGSIRYGKVVNGKLTWLGYISSSPYAIDVADFDVLRVALYVDTGTSVDEGASATYYNLQVEAGDRKTPFIGAMMTAIDTVARNDGFDVPGYYFENNYIVGKANRINELNSQSYGNGDCFIFITDRHTNRSTPHSSNSIIKYLITKCNIPRLFNGGDECDGANIVYAKDIENAFGKEMHFVVGNHEYGGNGQDNIIAYTYNCGKPEQIGNAERNYYYVDNPQQKIRYIVLNAFSKGTSSATTGYEQTQVDWFENVALNVEQGWTILIFTHTLININLATNTLSVAENGTGIVNAINNYSGNGIIACVIQGHTHLDRITHLESGVPVVITTCDNSLPLYSAESYDPALVVSRPFGTIRENAFDVAILNKTNRQITFVRIGCPAINAVDEGTGIEVEERTVTY